ncbi:ureidoglycolate lyase [Roseovarius sp. A-2]|nr:ureidoglycolate lyase [Roseovarius sp. A-2]
MARPGRNGPPFWMPVGQVGKLVCIGLNYTYHAAELGVEPPEAPVVFLKATSAINGPHDPVILPRGAVGRTPVRRE